MPTESAQWEILPSQAQTTTTAVTIIEPASSGTPASLRTLTHPDSANFPVVTYCSNPDRTLNFDQVPLAPPTSRILRTLDTTQVFVTKNEIDDVLVTETWQGSDRRTRMLASCFRRFYELSINPPELADPEVFIVWAPADRTTNTFNVIITGLRVGGGEQKLDVQEKGLFAAGVLDAVATGLIDRTVELDLKIVSQVAV